MSARYLTTTLPYVNADPHIGFALELVQADVLARSWRAAGEEVFFNTGTDEHGQKIYDAAAKAGREPQFYVDHYAAEIQKLKKALDLSTDAFIRTTSLAHMRAAQEMWRRCAENGDIYLKEYEGLYCVGHEAFLMEKDLVDGKCPDHNVEPQVLREKNYFFKFKKYEKSLLSYLERASTIVPEWRRQEAINFVKGGLEDFSISREKKRLSWGIPVPGDDSQVIYVWFDALTNYVSTLGWPDDAQGNFKKFWEEGKTIQVAGKDQVRFQSLMWQAMLMSAGIKNTDTLFYHGFITSSGKKMSKSLGNVINPFELVEKYGTDAIRYVLLRHVSPVEDSDLTREAIHDHYTAHLTNGLGNLVARVMKLAEEHLSGPVTLTVEDTNFEKAFTEKIESFAFNEAMDLLFEHVAKGNAYMTEKEPYKTVKTNPQEGKKEIERLVRHIAKIATNLSLVMPETARLISNAIRANKKPENLFPALMNVKYVDAHCHIQFDDYEADQAELIARMEREGVVGIVVGVDHASSGKAVALAEKYPHLFASVGLHPNSITAETFDETFYRTLAANPKVVAIGECGLDFFRPKEINDEVKRVQREVLKKHIELAAALDKPLIIHARPSQGTQDAYQDLIAILKKAKTAHPNLRGDVHFFVGGVSEAEALAALGFTISFTAVITFAHEYDSVIRTVPLASVLSETDSPYVAPASRRGKRNDPLAVVEVVTRIAEIRGEDPETVRAAILANAQRMFSFTLF